MSYPSISKSLQTVFGTPALPDGMFYAFEFGLRVELGGDERSDILRFLQAMDRSRAVVRALFPRPADMHVILARVAPARFTRADGKELLQLRRLGFKLALSSPERVNLGDEGDFWGDGSETLYRYLCAARPASGWTDIDALIWSSCAEDTRIQPRAAFDVFFVDFHQGLAAHIYDERGMDIVAMSRGPLMKAYRQFNSWLLDYDREQMDKTFKV